MNRKLRKSFLAMASSALLLVLGTLVALPAPATAPAIQAGTDQQPAPVAARATLRHGVAMPFFSFRPRS